MPRWLTRDEFTGMRDVFRYHLSEEEFASFEAEFIDELKRKGRSYRG
jgi:hypothetical protein